jgi:hypothetical protein
MVGMPFGHQDEHVTFAVGELVERGGVALAGHEPGDDGGVDDAFTLGDASDRVGEHRDVGDPLFEQVADALRMLLQQSHGVARLQVVGQNEHADRGVTASDPLSCYQPLVGVRRWHLRYWGDCR